MEIDLETDSFHHFSIEASGSYIHFDQRNSVGATESFACNLILSYENPDLLTAHLTGYYEDLNAVEEYDSKFYDIIWSLNISKGFSLANNTEVRIFVTGHNLFNGDQYLIDDTQNPGRWFEGGIKIAF
jgi:vitamin B12 transporter